MEGHFKNTWQKINLHFHMHENILKNKNEIRIYLHRQGGKSLTLVHLQDKKMLKEVFKVER